MRLPKSAILGFGTALLIFISTFTFSTTNKPNSSSKQISKSRVESIQNRVIETPDPTPSVKSYSTSDTTNRSINVTTPEPSIDSNSTELSNDNYYINSQGNKVHSPAYSNTGGTPAGATAKCRDGTYSFSQSRKGTCSHHGGVLLWL